MMAYQNSIEYARWLDSKDPLASMRERFYHPVINDKEVLYFTGNSLGLQPKAVKQHLEVELDEWAKWGVEGHFHSKNPWYSYHELLTPASARLVGAKEHEVVCMNSLTTNLHLLFVSFYRPTPQRFKILCEGKAFPSDRYLLETQVAHHGFSPEEAIIEVFPREGEHCLREEDILAAIEHHGDSLALVFFGGVNYFTGQVFDMKQITEHAHNVGAICGFDLAHAAGNIQLKLHEWNVDFAAWCSYKYLNSGPGAVAGAFVHERHASDHKLPRFAGWWGNDPETRFTMPEEFIPRNGADGWQLSNAPVFSMAALRASMEIFDEVGMEALTAKSKLLTGYMEYLIHDINDTLDGVNRISIITPSDSRGCQLSLVIKEGGKKVHDHLVQHGVIADWRHPNVIRVAPVPLYNNFEDVFRFGEIIKSAVIKYADDQKINS